MRLPAVLTVATVGAALALASPARADYYLDMNEPPTTPPGWKSEPLALGLSLGVTAASWSVIAMSIPSDSSWGIAGAVGAYFGPSLGHVYADRPFSRGFAMRTLGVVSIFGGAYTGLCGSECGGPRVSNGLYVTAAALVVVGTVDDIVRAPRAVRLHNARLKHVSVAPLITPEATGVALAGQF